MNMYEKQNEDLKTNAVRDDLIINLTDQEHSNLKSLAYKAGFKNAGELLSSFVGDITGWHSNGSDERDLAARWYERAFCPWIGYFRHYLFCNYNDLDSMQDMLEDAEFFEDVYEEYKAENAGRDRVESKEDCLRLLKEIIEEGKLL